MLDHLRGDELADLPVIVGGRSLGARVACRTVEATGAAAVLCLAFPLLPPRRGDKPPQSRLPELEAVELPVLVVQGESDRFGMPPLGAAAPGGQGTRGPRPESGHRGGRRGGRRLAREPPARGGAGPSARVGELPHPQIGLGRAVEGSHGRSTAVLLHVGDQVRDQAVVRDAVGVEVEGPGAALLPLEPHVAV